MIKSLRDALDRKKISVSELCSEYRKKAEEASDLNAFITLDFSNTDYAQKLIDKNEASMLTGIPVAVKDNIMTRGIKTTCASKMLENFIPQYNATVIKRLKKIGYVLSGKTNMDEFAMGNTSENSYFNAVKNPLCRGYVSGGSSGGSAAAVAAKLSPIALGSDTGGSVRQPAAFCGCCGLKPTYGKISRFGLIAFAPSLEQIGIISNSSEDALFMLNAISGIDTNDMTSVNSKPCSIYDVKGKIGLIKDFFDFSDPKIAFTVENSAKKLEKQGFVVEYCSLSSLKYAVSAYYIISSAEAASTLSRFDGVKYGYFNGGDSFYNIVKNSRSLGFGKEVKLRIMLGNYCLSQGFYEKYYIKAQNVQKKLKHEFSELFKSYDFLIMPTSPELPKKSGISSTLSETYNADILTVPANLTGLPALSVPCGEILGFPVGMSIMTKAFCESELLSLGNIFERKWGI